MNRKTNFIPALAIAFWLMTMAPFAFAYSGNSSASSSSETKNRYFIEGFCGFASVNPADLNTARQNFIWNGTAPSTGNFTKLNYFGGSLGRSLGSHFKLSVSYEQQYQALGKTEIGSGMTVADYFTYAPVLLLLEIPFQGKHFGISFGGGVGYAISYEFHQQYSGTLEDIAYKSHPMVYRGRVTVSFALSKHFAIFAEGKYDKVNAPSLATDKAYQATVNGAPLTSGKTFNDASGNSPVKADMSGLRYGLGLRLMF